MIIMPDNDNNYFNFRFNRMVHKIKCKDILYFSCYGHRITLVASEGKYEFNDSMKNIEQQLVSKGFIRIHQSYIVNMQYIGIVLGDDLRMTNGDWLQISRGYKKRIWELL